MERILSAAEDDIDQDRQVDLGSWFGRTIAAGVAWARSLSTVKTGMIWMNELAQQSYHLLGPFQLSKQLLSATDERGPCESRMVGNPAGLNSKSSCIPFALGQYVDSQAASPDDLPTPTYLRDPLVQHLLTNYQWSSSSLPNRLESPEIMSQFKASYDQIVVRYTERIPLTKPSRHVPTTFTSGQPDGILAHIDRDYRTIDSVLWSTEEKSPNVATSDDADELFAFLYEASRQQEAMFIFARVIYDSNNNLKDNLMSDLPTLWTKVFAQVSSVSETHDSHSTDSTAPLPYYHLRLSDLRNEPRLRHSPCPVHHRQFHVCRRTILDARHSIRL